MESRLKAIAIHLPQYHPIPENNIWWGKGFTEWTNVTKAKPLFKNHYQPHLPSELGFYDLRLENARLEQERLAKENGIYGFCYYHYWFNGKLLLEKPIESKLANKKEDLPFMFCWANENWTRTWDGGDNLVLLEQKYSVEDDIAHIRYLLPFLKDHRYIRVENKPVLAIYRTSRIPDVAKTINTWRSEALKEGIELYLCKFESYGEEGPVDGIDASIEFQPFIELLYKFQKKQEIISWKQPIKKISLKTFRLFGFKNQVNKIIWQRRNRLDYEEYINWIISNYEYPKTYLRYPSVFPSWDNTARRGSKSFLFKNSTPKIFEKLLTYHLKNFRPSSNDKNLIFINAWNEWAEGNHLEPCQRFGNEYLEIIKKYFCVR